METKLKDVEQEYKKVVAGLNQLTTYKLQLEGKIMMLKELIEEASNGSSS